MTTTEATTTCTVCLETLPKEEVDIKTLTCGHRFCKVCIDRWLTINPTCILCRKPLLLPKVSELTYEERLLQRPGWYRNEEGWFYFDVFVSLSEAPCPHIRDVTEYRVRQRERGRLVQRTKKLIIETILTFFCMYVLFIVYRHVDSPNSPFRYSWLLK